MQSQLLEEKKASCDNQECYDEHPAEMIGQVCPTCQKGTIVDARKLPNF